MVVFFFGEEEEDAICHVENIHLRRMEAFEKKWK